MDFKQKYISSAAKSDPKNLDDKRIVISDDNYAIIEVLDRLIKTIKDK